MYRIVAFKNIKWNLCILYEEIGTICFKYYRLKILVSNYLSVQSVMNPVFVLFLSKINIKSRAYIFGGRMNINWKDCERLCCISPRQTD